MVKTKTGLAELVDKYGPGRNPRCNGSSTPATLLCDDGDGHYAVWKFTGTLDDAASAVASLYTSDDMIVEHVTRGRLDAIPTPDDFWIEGSDGWLEPNLNKYPEILAY